MQKIRCHGTIPASVDLDATKSNFLIRAPQIRKEMLAQKNLLLIKIRVNKVRYSR